MSELAPRQPADSSGEDGEQFDERHAAVAYGYGDSGVEVDELRQPADTAQQARDEIWSKRRDAAFFPSRSVGYSPFESGYVNGRKTVTVELPDTEEQL